MCIIIHLLGINVKRQNNDFTKENDRLYRYLAKGLSTNKNGHLCIILCVNQELRAYAFVLAT